jgi:hypothetical protein
VTFFHEIELGLDGVSPYLYSDYIESRFFSREMTVLIFWTAFGLP